MARLIDANALRRKICAACEERLACTDMGNICFEVACIDNAPTVDAEPIRHGRWVKQFAPNWDMLHKCSLCGHRTHGRLWETSGKIELDTFCGGCGARMDGDVP